ncbi:hypothetical protein JOF56_001874 [Kibdelosporangium banguiense]|uniref:Uncharacterized protein n=1 Tax=Kibdelosporangium banguiense TaxID=1365924 RepID=A0ABS4TBY4_9PSEU|nr:hypothetical protein [Kibdelosporangium banguiense]MBP2321489.1 hypothetical protein [Kibdelosporangium banguiense]
MTSEFEPGHYPDGLDEKTINVLLAEVQAELRTAARPTSALLDGSAAERRRRRIENRAMSAVVRTLPVRRPAASSDGQEAA